MRYPGIGGEATSALAQVGETAAVVLAVLIVGATFYMWRHHYVRSRAALIAIAALVLFLLYLGFFAGGSPT